MILPEFTYLAPKSLDEAIALLLEKGSKAKIMAGGTDVINPLKDNALKDNVVLPEYIVDIKNIPDMDQLTYDPEKGLTIGALTKIYDVEHSEIVKKEYPALAEAAHVIASNQIRSKGTIAGNICNASPSADSVPSLIVLDAQLEIVGPNGTRMVPVEKFFTGFKKIELGAGELVKAIHVPPMSADTKAAYIKFAVRKAMDLAIVGVAAKVTVQDGVCKDAKIGLGAVAIHAVRAPHAEELLIGSDLSDAVLEKAGEAAMLDCAPISDIRASAEYRHDMVRVHVKRAVLKAMEQFN